MSQFVTTITTGTLQEALDQALNSTTLDIAEVGTAAAELSFTGDNNITYANPTVDDTSLIASLVPGQTAAGTTVLNASGRFVNQGTILADGPAGSTFTLNIEPNGTGATAAAAPGYFINYGTIMVDAGNKMTINITGTSALFNAGTIVANGGSLFINSASNVLDAGFAGVQGLAVIEGGGTLETNVSVPTADTNFYPYYAFADGDAGDTLKIDNIKQFDGQIRGFRPGDTIDLGSVLSVGTIVYGTTLDGDIILALENTSGSVVASLAITGVHNYGTFAVVDGSADGFNFTTGGDGDTLLTTSVSPDEWNNTSGTWQTASDWDLGIVPGATLATGIGQDSISSFTLTTGSSPLTTEGFTLWDPNALVEITSDTSLKANIGTGVVESGPSEVGGTIEVTTGNTLSAGNFNQFAGAELLLDPGSVVNLLGAFSTSDASNGVITVDNGSTQAARFGGTTMINGATLDAGPNQPTTGADGGSVYVGYGYPGTPATVTVENGGVVTDTSAILGSDPTSFGVLTLSGAGTSWSDEIDPDDALNSRGYMIVGDNAFSGSTPAGVAQPLYAFTALLTVENDATLTDARAYIGDATDSAGSVTVSSGGQWNIGLAAGGYLAIADGGQGTLSVVNGGTVHVGNVGTFLSNGSNVTGGGIGVGYAAGAAGTITVSGANSLLNDSGIALGRVSQGIMNILNGGTVSVAAGITAGLSAGASGTILVSGFGSSLLNSGSSSSVVIGDVGAGTLTVQDGGLVQTYDNLDLGGTGSGPLNGSGTVSVTSSGRLQAYSSIFIWAGSTLSVDSASGVDVGYSGTYQTGAIEIESGGNHDLWGAGLIQSNVVNNGQIVASNINTGTFNATSSGKLEITGAVTGSGIMQIAPGATLQLDGSLGAGQTIDFVSGSAPSTLILGSPSGTISNPITGYAAGDKIEFSNGITINSASVLNGTTLAIVYHNSVNTVGTYDLTDMVFAPNTPTTYAIYNPDFITNDAAVLPVNDMAWVGGTGTSVQTAANWNTDSVPGAASGLMFGNGTAGTLGGSASVVFLQFFNAGTWTLASGTTLAAEMSLGIGNQSGGGPNGFGDLVVGSGSTLESDGFINVGDNAGDNAVLTITGGGVVDATAPANTAQYAMTIGSSPASGTLAASTGSVVVTGAGSLLNLGVNGLSLGNKGGSGSMTVSQGGSVIATTTNSNINNSIAIGRTGNGTLTVTDPGSQVIATGVAYISHSANGTLTVENSATFLAALDQLGLGGLVVGDGSTNGVGGTGAATVTTDGVLASKGYVAVGVRGTAGQLTVLNSGTVEVGTTLTVGAGGTIAPGVIETGNGTLTIGAGGTVELTGGPQTSSFGVYLSNSNIGAASTENAVATISGTGALLNTEGNGITVAQYGTATLTISQGGSVISGTENSNLYASLTVGRQGDGTVMVTGTGSQLTANGASSFGRAGNGSLIVENQSSAMFGLDGLGNGGLSIGGSGGANSSGTIYLGGTGTALVASSGNLFSQANITVGQGGVTGTLTVQSSGTAEAEGQLLIGNTITVAAGDTVISPDATTTVLDTPATYNGTGTVTVGAGGLLQVDGTGVSGAPDIIVAAGAGSTGILNVTGAGALLTNNNGTLAVGGAGSGTLDVSSGGSLQVGSLTEAADGTIVLAGGTIAASVSSSSTGEFSGFGDFSGQLANSSTVTASGGTLELTGSVTGSGVLQIANNAILRLDAAPGAGQSVSFGEDAELILNAPGTAFGNAITGLGASDRIEFGNGMTITSASVVNASTIAVHFTSGGTSGVYDLTNVGLAASSAGALSTGVDAATGDSYIQIENSTWTWKGGTGAANSSANWTLSGGPGNAVGHPAAGDTAIDATGTVVTALDTQFNGDTLEVGGTGGTVAALSVIGDTGISFANPTFNSSTELTSAVPSNSTSETSELDLYGTSVNQGTILADGPAGSRFTIAIAGTTVNGTVLPGYAYNTGVLQADAGNTLTIEVGASSELFNTGSIVADGGTVRIIAAASAIDGGSAPVRSIAVIEGGGTLETDSAYASTVSGTGGFYVFGDSTPGNTLKIDNIGSFGGRITGFSAGDTIDLGNYLAVGTLVYDTNSSFLYLENNGTILASLIMGGPFASGTYALNSGTADGFSISTGADGDTVLTTSQTDPVTSGTSGTWQSTATWINGTIAGAGSDPLIGQGATSNFTLTTGSSPVSVAGFVITAPQATLQITSDTTATSQSMNDFAGTLDVEAGNTLSGSALQIWDPSAAVTIAAGATLALAGRLNPNLAPVAGVWTDKPGDNFAATFSTGTVEIDGALLAGPTAAVGGGSVGIGYDSDQPARVTVNSGGTVTDTYLLVGSDPTSSGTLTLNGAGASWTDAIVTSDTAHSTGFILVGYNDISSDTPAGLTAPGPAGTAQVLIENGATLTDQEAGYIGDSVDSAGNVTVEGTGALWNLANNGVGFLNVGYLGSGSLSVLNGGSVAIGSVGTFDNNDTTFTGGGIGVGGSIGASGTVTISGAGSQLSTLDGMAVGKGGQGLLSILNGGTVQINAGGLSVGTSADVDSSGTVIVGGSGAAAALHFAPASGTVAAASGLTVGSVSEGTLNVSDNGTINLNGTGYLTIGSAAGSAGDVVVGGTTAAAVINIGTEGLTVGNAGTGYLTVESLGTISLTGNRAILIGQSAGAVGTMTVNGGFVTESATASGLLVGYGAGAAASLLIENGGTVALAGGGITVGVSAEASGVVTVTGVGSNLTASAGIQVGSLGSGTLDIRAGGFVDAGTGAVDIGSLGSVVGAGLVEAAVVNNGEMTAAGGTLELTGAVSGTGGVTLAAGSALRLDATVGSGQSFTFSSGAPEDLILGTPETGFTDAIDGLATGDRIEFGNGMTITSASVVNGNTIAVDFTSGGSPGVYELTNVSFAAVSGNQFSVGVDSSTGDSYVQVVPTVIATNGTTTLAQAGDTYELNPASGGTGPSLMYDGSVVTAGEFGAGITPVGAVQTAIGYEVAWSLGVGKYVVWNTDLNGNYTSAATGVVSGSSATLEAVEANFGDGVFPGAGPIASTTTIATNGVMALVQVGNLFELSPAVGGTGPLLEYQDSFVTAGQFGPTVTPVGAEQTATGYQVVWGLGGNECIVWNTDANGDYTSSATGILSGSSYALEELELSFGDDLNGDGTIGPTTTLIASNGVTRLVQVANQYALENSSGGFLAWVSYQGSAVTVGQFGTSLTPVGAVQTASGYRVTWSLGANEYVVWNTDSNGNFTSSATGIVSGTSATLEAVEANFGDGVFPGAGSIASTTTIATNGVTALVQVGNLFELNPAGGGTGPLLEYQGGFVTAGEFGATVVPVGAVQTGNGYEVAWSLGANEYVVWNTDSNGNYTSAATGIVSGNSPTLETVEANFGDGIFSGAGPIASTTTIATNGTTALVQVGNLFELNPAGGGTEPLLEYQGSFVTAGEFGATVKPIGAIQTASGYEVAWSLGSNEYVVWTTDSNGNYTSSATGILSGTSYALEELELTFSEHLNGAGPIGPTTTTIAANGVTSLVQVANQYALENGGGSGPFLMYQGSAVTVGQFGTGVTPVGAVQTAGGYEVAWSLGSNEYVVWNTDSNGNYTSSATGILSGNSSTLEAVEANFGAGVLPGAGPVASTTTIATNGTTSLVQVGNLFELNHTSGGTGPLLEYQGNFVTAGEFGASVTPVGAVRTASGYEVAWSLGANEYVIWNTDSNGNYTSSATGVVSGESATLEALEANFGEVFPGAGPIASTTTIATNDTTTLAQVGNLFELNPTSGTGPLLEYQGSFVTAGEFGSGVTPVGAKQTGNGYEVAWSLGANEYVVWNTDSNGNYTSSATDIVSGSSPTLEAVEANFGDGVLPGAGPVASTTTIATNGTTSLVQVGNLFELNPTSGGTGPLLEYQGNFVTAGEFGASVTPVGAVQTASGYEVAWGLGSNEYVVWNTDSNGNYTSSATGVVSGESFALEDLEPAFGKDLNGDGRLSAVLVTSTGAGNTVDLTGQTQATTINLGGNTASASAGLNAPSLAFIGTPDAITLGSSADTIEYSLEPSSGIETIADFVLGQDELNIDLMGTAASTLQLYSTTVGGVHAIAIASSADPTNGLVLLNMPTGDTATDLLASHTTFSGGHALIG